MKNQKLNLEENQVLNYNQLLAEVKKPSTSIRNRYNLFNKIKMFLGLPYKETLEVYYLTFDKKERLFKGVKFLELELLTYNEFNTTKILKIKEIKEL